jgi:hypothetical protein
MRIPPMPSAAIKTNGPQPGACVKSRRRDGRRRTLSPTSGTEIFISVGQSRGRRSSGVSVASRNATRQSLFCLNSFWIYLAPQRKAARYSAASRSEAWRVICDLNGAGLSGLVVTTRANGVAHFQASIRGGEDRRRASGQGARATHGSRRRRRPSRGDNRR